MIQLDPEEIFGGAIWEAIRRVLAIFACLYLGSIMALVGAMGYETVTSVVSSGFSSYPDYDFGAELFLLPFWSFGSAFAFLAIPTILIIAVYYFKTEDPTRKRFIQFTTMQQVVLAGAFGEYALEYSPSFLKIMTVVVGGLFFQAIAWALFYFALTFVKNKERIGHEEHLMAVAAENAVWRNKVESMEHIPAPPSGPQPPKARALKGE